MRLIGFRRSENSGVASLLTGLPVVIGVLAVGAVLAGAYELSRQEIDASAEVSLTLTVFETVERIQDDLQTGLSEGRGYYLSMDPGDLARSNAAFDRIASDIASIRKLCARSPEETKVLDHLEPLLNTRIDALRHTMTLPFVPYPVELRTQERRRAAQRMTAEILDDLNAIRTEERGLLERRRTRIARIVSVLTWDMVAGGMIAATSGFAMIAMLIGRGRERRHMAELSRLNTELEARVRDRTAALARSEARQRGYFDNSPIGMYVARRREDGQVVHDDVNPAFAAIYGLSRDDMLGRTVRDLWPEPFARDVEQRIQACIAGGQLAQYTVTRDLRGGTRTLDVMIVPFPDESGTVSCVLGCLRDVTEKVELERQVLAHLSREAEAAELERVLLWNSPDVLSLIRVEGDVESPIFFYEACSPAIESLTGLRPDAMVGRRPEEVLPPTIADEVNRRFRLCVREMKTVTYATSTSLATGPRDLEGSATPVLHPVTGRVYRIVALARDVTERKRIEATLRQTQKREALGQLTSGVAHDVNNVLAVISNGYDTIEVASTDPVVRDCVSTGRAAVDQAAGLVRHLLAFARHNPAPSAIIDTASALAEITKLCRHALDDATALTLDVVGEPWAISVDRHLLQAALLNLVTNARDAMPDGGAIAIAACNVPAAVSPDDGSGAPGVDSVAISVRDTGTGMSPDLIRNATEPFFTTKPGAAGAGLGLAMVDGFARQSNGRLRIESAPGRGTVVTISLPRAAGAASPSPPPGTPRPTGRGVGERTILVVDDNAAMLRSTGLLLRTFGYNVLTASDGDTAFALAARHAEIDLVMTDIAMRGGNGIVLAERLETLRPKLPVVFMTGFVSEADATGGRPVLRKPVSMRDMLAAFDAAFSARDSGTAATNG